MTGKLNPLASQVWALFTCLIYLFSEKQLQDKELTKIQQHKKPQYSNLSTRKWVISRPFQFCQFSQKINKQELNILIYYKMLVTQSKIKQFYQYWTFLNFMMLFIIYIRMIVFLRHAQRGDNELPMKLSEIQYDPPIIQASNITVLQTSRQIAAILKMKNITKFQILTSPFLRCIMTANKLHANLEKFGFIMNPSSYQIDNRICEYLREDWFKQYPLDKLIYHSQYLPKYVDQTEFSQIQTSKDRRIQFPQNYVKFHLRVTDFRKKLQFPESDTCLLIVTHGFVVRQMCFSMNELPEYQREIKYCGYAAYVKEKNIEKLVKAKL